MMNGRIFSHRHHKVMEIRFGQGRYEINTGLFQGINYLSRDFPFSCFFLGTVLAFIANTKAAVKRVTS